MNTQCLKPNISVLSDGVCQKHFSPAFQFCCDWKPKIFILDYATSSRKNKNLPRFKYHEIARILTAYLVYFTK